jgi:hypothetical protein
VPFTSAWIPLFTRFPKSTSTPAAAYAFFFCGERAIDEDEVFAMELSVFEEKVEESIRLNPTNWDDDYGAPSHVCRFADQLERGNHR